MLSASVVDILISMLENCGNANERVSSNTMFTIFCNRTCEFEKIRSSAPFLRKFKFQHQRCHCIFTCKTVQFVLVWKIQSLLISVISAVPFLIKHGSVHSRFQNLVIEYANSSESCWKSLKIPLKLSPLQVIKMSRRNHGNWKPVQRNLKTNWAGAIEMVSWRVKSCPNVTWAKLHLQRDSTFKRATIDIGRSSLRCSKWEQTFFTFNQLIRKINFLLQQILWSASQQERKQAIRSWYLGPQLTRQTCRRLLWQLSLRPSWNDHWSALKQWHNQALLHRLRQCRARQDESHQEDHSTVRSDSTFSLSCCSQWHRASTASWNEALARDEHQLPRELAQE